jgi:polyisoprenoid-binding protein YceI
MSALLFAVALTLAPAPPPALTGYWTQDSVDCGAHVPAEPVRELYFGDDGTFKLTFTPFERYIDYWGDFTFDPAAARLNFTIDSGNLNGRPAQLEAHATVQDGSPAHLTLEHVYLGSTADAPDGGCRYVFRKR